MAFDCLYNLVGVRAGLVTPEPLSGLYVTALPDITLTELTKIANEEQKINGTSLWSKIWEDVEKRTVLKFRTLFIAELNRCYQISDLSIAECLICENKLLLATSLWYLLGAELMFERLYTDRINRYTTIDRAKANDLRNELMTLFQSELQISVAGIDLKSSSCIDHAPESRNIVTTHLPII